jgi:hypothetical protein
VLDGLGIGYSREQRQQIERICWKEEVRCGRALSAHGHGTTRDEEFRPALWDKHWKQSRFAFVKAYLSRVRQVLKTRGRDSRS